MGHTAVKFAIVAVKSAYISTQFSRQNWEQAYIPAAAEDDAAEEPP